MAQALDVTEADYHALARDLTEHDRRYHVQAAPTIADVEYDRLVLRLRAIEEAHPAWVVPWSPTQRVASSPRTSWRA